MRRKFALYSVDHPEGSFRKKDVGYTEYQEIQEESLSDAEYQAFLQSLIRTLKLIQIRPHEEWQLSGRAINVLKTNGVHTAWDLLQLKKEEIIRMPRCGIKIILEIYMQGAENGLALPNWLAAVGNQYSATLYPRKLL